MNLIANFVAVLGNGTDKVHDKAYDKGGDRPSSSFVFNLIVNLIANFVENSDGRIDKVHDNAYDKGSQNGGEGTEQPSFPDSLDRSRPHD